MSLLYFVTPDSNSPKELKALLQKHPEVKFLSLIAVDLGNNSTDEKIPTKAVIDDLDNFLVTGVQTDGSSVYLPKIAEINNAKVDLIPDMDVKWFVDYNYESLDENGNPIGTLVIPGFLTHEDKMVCSRSILKRSVEHFSKELKTIINDNAHIKTELGMTKKDTVKEVVITTATELEFWVKTPDHRSNLEKLTASQILKEQYWKRTIGPVRTALEQCLTNLDLYDFEAEMGHKEVGGVPSKLKGMSKFTHVMEQLEVDWKYSTAMQSSDNELFAKHIIGDTFSRLGLDVNFAAKPIEGVAGSGEHHHFGVAAILSNGKRVNLFTPLEPTEAYMSSIAWGALMGLLKNYEAVNPFVSSTNDAFNRLKPGFEAPVCTVTSLGHTTEVPSRNRTVLVGLVRDLANPYATRFELRSPNPNSNTYLTTAASFQTMLDGITKVAPLAKSQSDLEKEFNKAYGEEGFYLETLREYRSEEDVFEHYTAEERNRLFAKPPATVWENISSFKNCPEKIDILKSGGVFTDKIIESYDESLKSQWLSELVGRLIPNNINLIRHYTKLHTVDDATNLDIVNWENIKTVKASLMKDSIETKSLFTRIKTAISEENYDTASNLQIEMGKTMSDLKTLYAEYKQNLIEIAIDDAF